VPLPRAAPVSTTRSAVPILDGPSHQPSSEQGAAVAHPKRPPHGPDQPSVRGGRGARAFADESGETTLEETTLDIGFPEGAHFREGGGRRPAGSWRCDGRINTGHPLSRGGRQSWTPTFPKVGWNNARWNNARHPFSVGGGKGAI
jgi:hypothetical protein